MEFGIRPIGIEALEAVYDVETACFLTPWEKKDIAKDLAENPCARYLGVFSEEKLIGYGSLWFIMEEGHVMSVAILPEYRRLGAGEALMRALMQTASNGGAKYMELECRAGNTAAKAMYHKLGFLRVGCRKGYYTDTGEDAIVYALIVMPTPHPEDDPFLREIP